MKILTNKSRTVGTLLFVSMIALSPVLGFADNNKNKDKHANNGNANNKPVGCVQIYNMFVAQGWLQGGLAGKIGDDCKFPFGIFNRWFKHDRPHNNGTTTPADVTKPTISSINVNPNKTSAEFKWTTNEKTASMIFYGTTTPVVTVSGTSTGNLSQSASSTNSQVKTDATLRTGHELTVNRLTASTTYYAIIAARDTAGNLTLSGVTTFNTDTSGDVTAPVVRDLRTTISSTGLKITWQTNETTKTRLFYGTSTLDINASTTSRLVDADFRSNHSLTLPPISTLTSLPYHFRIESTDRNNNVSLTSEYVVSSSF